METQVPEQVNVEQQVTQPTQQAPEQPKTEADKPKELMSAQFAALAKKEKMALQRQREAEAKLKEAEEKLKLYQSYEEKKKNAKLDPFSYLSEAGLSYDELTEIVLKGGGKPLEKDKVSEIEERLNSLLTQKEQEEKARSEKEAQALKEQEEKIIAEFKKGVNKFLEDNQDKYELVNLYSAQELVIATIEQHYEAKGEILSNDVAAELVEKHLEEEVKKLSKSKKFSSNFKLEQQSEAKKPGTNSTTLASSQPSSSVPSMLSSKTEEDRLKRALAALG